MVVNRFTVIGNRAGGGARSGGGGGSRRAGTINPDGSFNYARWNDKAAQKLFDKQYKKWSKTNGHSFGVDMGLASVNNWYGTNFKKALIAPTGGYVSNGKTQGGVDVSLLLPS